MKDIESKKALDDDMRKRLTDAINEYKGGFLAGLKDKSEAEKKSAEAQVTPASAMAADK
jgi:hypothetical protein